MRQKFQKNIIEIVLCQPNTPRHWACLALWIIYPVEHLVFQETDISFVSICYLQIVSQLWMGPCVEFPLSLLGPYQAATSIHLVCAATFSVSSYVHPSCYVCYTLFPCCHISPLALTIFSAIMGFMIPGKRPQIQSNFN